MWSHLGVNQARAHLPSPQLYTSFVRVQYTKTNNLICFKQSGLWLNAKRFIFSWSYRVVMKSTHVHDYALRPVNIFHCLQYILRTEVYQVTCIVQRRCRSSCWYFHREQLAVWFALIAEYCSGSCSVYTIELTTSTGFDELLFRSHDQHITVVLKILFMVSEDLMFLLHDRFYRSMILIHQCS